MGSTGKAWGSDELSAGIAISGDSGQDRNRLRPLSLP